MIIVCDIDSVLNNLMERTLEMYNGQHQTNLKLSDITSYNFADCLSQDEADGLVELFKQKELWDSLKPQQNSQDALKRLIKRGHQIYLATATDPVNFNWKIEWLKRYFPFISPYNVIRIMNKGLLKADVLIDDCLDNLIGTFAERICFDRPWNQSDTKDAAFAVK